MASIWTAHLLGIWQSTYLARRMDPGTYETWRTEILWKLLSNFHDTSWSKHKQNRVLCGILSDPHWLAFPHSLNNLQTGSLSVAKQEVKVSNQLRISYFTWRIFFPNRHGKKNLLLPKVLPNRVDILQQLCLKTGGEQTMIHLRARMVDISKPFSVSRLPLSGVDIQRGAKRWT